MGYLLAIAAAALYGGADFLGGLGSRRASTIAVVVTSQTAGLVALLLVIPLLPSTSPSAVDLAWGATAGVAGGVGVALLYRALAIGRMAVVAPTTALCAVMIPVVADLLAGQRLPPITSIGVVLALVAVVLVSREATEPNSHTAGAGVVPPGVGIALVSGVAVGLFFLALARASTTSGLWPIVGARAASVSVFGAIALANAKSLVLAPPVSRIAVVAGVVDMAANVLYLVATRYTPLAVAVTLTSLYPASTVLLARFVLGERLNPWQTTGVACALVAVTLMVGGGWWVS